MLYDFRIHIQNLCLHSAALVSSCFVHWVIIQLKLIKSAFRGNLLYMHCISFLFLLLHIYLICASFYFHFHLFMLVFFFSVSSWFMSSGYLFFATVCALVFCQLTIVGCCYAMLVQEDGDLLCDHCQLEWVVHFFP